MILAHRSSSLWANARLPACRCTFSTSTAVLKHSRAVKTNYNHFTFSDTPDAKHVNYRRVDANDMENSREPPTEVKMLVRDFIEDSLYNPHYGYFPRQATIFTATDPIDFNNMRNGVEFQNEVAKRYETLETEGEGPGRQIWHTPTELFKPWYGRAIAQCLVAEYLLKYYPYEDLVIYEIGAGNGTLAKNVLDYLRDLHPKVYEQTRYHIIEISASLADLQRKLLLKEHANVTVTNKSIFRWDTPEPSPCFFLAMEVIDNFAHDMIRYDMKTLEPYQGIVTIDDHGDFSTYYTRVTDPLIASFIALRRQLGHPPPIPRLLKLAPSLRSIYTSLPLAPNLSAPEFIPTRLLTLLRTLQRCFPRHRLLLSDFSSLPDTVPGVCAPVVQARIRGTVVPCDTVFVKQGYFDIFFPTDFSKLNDMYEHVLTEPNVHPSLDMDDSRATPLSTTISPLTAGANFFSSYHPSTRRTPIHGVASASGLPVGERKSSVFTHAEFMDTYADLGRTKLKSGENPMLEFYQNVKFLF
ncbi:S-adenosyl-L-methionine-dependent methyltransferase [Cytidiella melzeri]|nr:S-adenosyl-L-methionine-dependent methyltransferase [Cytidiella melzeri]